MNPTIITGWIAAIIIFFNFSTCLVMPWAKKHIEEPDKKECQGKHCHSAILSSYHKPVVILSIISVIAHIIVSLIF